MYFVCFSCVWAEDLIMCLWWSCFSLLSCRRAVMDRVFSEAAHYRSSWHHFLTPGTDAWTHTHTAHVTLVQCGGFFAHRCSESVPDPWIPSGFRLFERSVEDECGETGLSGWWQLLFLDRPHFYLYSLHPREQTTLAHVSESKIGFIVLCYLNNHVCLSEQMFQLSRIYFVFKNRGCNHNK